MCCCQYSGLKQRSADVGGYAAGTFVPSPTDARSQPEADMMPNTPLGKSGPLRRHPAWEKLTGPSRHSLRLRKPALRKLRPPSEGRETDIRCG